MTTSPIHSKQTTADGIHTTVSYTYADAAARLAATGFVPGDVGKMAMQASDGSLWMLADDAPITWVTVVPPGGTVGLTSSAPVDVTRTAAAVGVATDAARADHKHDIAVASPVTIGTANSTGVSSSLALADHVHAHGSQTVGTLHAAVIPAGTSGFMTGADKSKLDVSAKSYLQWGNSSVSGTTTTRYLSPGYGDATAQTTPIQQVVPTAGTLRNLRVKHNSPAGNGNAIVYTVRINGAATGVTVSLASTGTDGADTVNTAAVVAGDKIDIIVTKAVTVGASPGDVTASLEVRA